MGNANGILVGNSEGNKQLGNNYLYKQEEDNIKMDLRATDEVVRTGSIWLRIKSVKGSCERCNESSSSIKCWGRSSRAERRAIPREVIIQTLKTVSILRAEVVPYHSNFWVV
jgi:hypothetical protein